MTKIRLGRCGVIPPLRPSCPQVAPSAGGTEGSQRYGRNTCADAEKLQRPCGHPRAKKMPPPPRLAAGLTRQARGQSTIRRAMLHQERLTQHERATPLLVRQTPWSSPAGLQKKEG